jgi:peptidoglycan/LPS O-acetylase OafA/YrhL
MVEGEAATEGGTARAGFIPELEGLRGLLAAWVFAFHFLVIGGHWDRLPPRLQAVLDGGRAVDVFLILSGFVITGTLLSKRDGYWQFIFRRFLRIYPV